MGPNSPAPASASDRPWRLAALRGVAAVAFAAAFFAVPETGLARLVRLFAVYLLLDGTLAAAAAAAARTGRRLAPLLEAGTSLAIGLLAAVAPDIRLNHLVAGAAAWAILCGAARVAVRGAVMLRAAGALAILWAALMLLLRAPGVAAFAHWLGVYAGLFGVLTLVQAGLVRRTVA